MLGSSAGGLTDGPQHDALGLFGELLVRCPKRYDLGVERAGRVWVRHDLRPQGLSSGQRPFVLGGGTGSDEAAIGDERVERRGLSARAL